jgi:hypothetical protein
MSWAVGRGGAALPEKNRIRAIPLNSAANKGQLQ